MRIATRLALLALACSPLFSTPLMNQIGAPTNIAGNGFRWSSQRFEPSLAAFDANFIDDFTVSGGTTQLGRFQAVVVGFQTEFTGFQNVQSWSVEVYSSVAAGGANLTGDVASQTFLPGDVTVGGTVNSIAGTALLTIDLTSRNILLGDGTYWIGVIPRMNRNTGQIAVFTSSFAGAPGGANGFQVNPGQGYGFGQSVNRNGNAAYNLESVPEPATLLVTASALGLLALTRRRLRYGKQRQS